MGDGERETAVKDISDVSSVGMGKVVVASTDREKLIAGAI